MRIYVYKILIFVVAIFFLYHSTIGYNIYKLQNKLYSSIDKKTLNEIKQKIRDELNDSLKKDNILNKEDAILIKKIFNKLSSDLKISINK